MADADLSSKLLEKMTAEQDRYRDWLTSQPPAEILNHAVEYATREDILMEMEELSLSDDQVRALLASPDTMADVYKSFSKMIDTTHMEVVRESIEEEAHRLIESGVLNQPEPVKQEGVYLVDRSTLFHLKEAEGGSFDYAAFDRQSKTKVAEGHIGADTVMDGIDPSHDFLTAARDAAIQDAGMDGIVVAQVGLTSLRDFRDSDIRRRGMFEPDTLPKDDIRFINSRYDEQFRIPNGGTIDIEYPDRIVTARCEYIDEYHAYIGSEVYHMCQFAELVERNGGVIRPEPVMEADVGAWKIGWDKFLAVECGAGVWDYHLFDSQMTELKSGEVEVVGRSINEVRDMILAENKLGLRSMTQTDHGMLMDKAAARAEERGEKRESVLGQLSALKASQKDQTAPTPEKKHREESR